MVNKFGSWSKPQEYNQVRATTDTETPHGDKDCDVNKLWFLLLLHQKSHSFFPHTCRPCYIHLPSIAHPFVVLQRSCEAHGLNELCEGPDFFLAVLGCLLHTAELTNETERKTVRREWQKGERGDDSKVSGSVRDDNARKNARDPKEGTVRG